MGHDEAIEMMASERYLLDELTPDLRDAYEDHLFGCAECANDVRFGAAFIDQAKTILPGLQADDEPVSGKRAPVKAAAAKREWFAWLRPAIMVPVFASLLAIVGYQNFVVFPALEAAATEPQLLPQATVLHSTTRAGGIPVIHADLAMGSSITVEMPANANYASYKFNFYNSKSKLIWSRSLPGTAAADGTVPLWLPGRTKQDSYRLAIRGITSTGENILLQEQFFNLEVNK